MTEARPLASLNPTLLDVLSLYVVLFAAAASVALGIVLVSALFFPASEGISAELKKLNWASIVMAIAPER